MKLTSLLSGINDVADLSFVLYVLSLVVDENP
jgi:hypothetical protein